MVGLGDLAGGLFSSYATGVSADGSVVVGAGNTASGNQAFTWDSVNGMQRLADVLTGLGLDLTGWTLSEASAVSADGLTIVGIGSSPSSGNEAWIAHIPEPATGSLLGLGLVGLAALRRRLS
jgi:probable HAF family extracellular repeat protein